MKKRPRALLLYSVLMAATAIGFPLQLFLLQDMSSLNLSQVWMHLSDLNIITIAVCALAAKYSYEASDNIFAVAPFAIVIMGLNNWWVGHVALDYSMLQTSLGTLGFLVVNSLLFQKEALLVLSKPRLRWWLTSVRKASDLPVAIHPWVGPSINSTTQNISKTGILVSSSHLGGLNIGDKVQMRLSLDSHLYIRCTAQLVRYADSKANQISAAFHFENLESEDRVNLNHYIDSLTANKYESASHPR